MLRRDKLASQVKLYNTVSVNQYTVSFRMSWKDIIFIPFNSYIMYGFMILIYFSLLILVYQLRYTSKTLTALQTYSFVVNLLYWCHTILLILHRLMKEHRSKQSYEPVEWWLLTIDVISIIPILQIVSLYSNFTWFKRPPSITTMRVVYGMQLIRVVRVVVTYKTLRFQPGFDQRLVLIAFHYMTVILLAHCIGALYYHISCFMCNTPDWTTPFIDFDFDPASNFMWMLICHTVSMTLVLHNAMVSIFFISKWEALLAIFAMMLGFVLQYFYLYGTLIAENLQAVELKNNFQSRLLALDKYMRLINLSDNMRNDINEYYRIIWNYRKGMTRVPNIINLLPDNTKVDISTDVFWEFFMHSPLLSITSEAFKRFLSKYVNECTYVSGQNIVTKGKVSHKMLYLVNGIIQIMSDDNPNSPILSFSSGTFIGEIPCLMPMASSATIRCATNCEFHVLKYRNLWKSMRKYPEYSSYLTNTIRSRVKYARIKQRLARASGADGSHIIWIKNQWRHIVKSTMKKSKKGLNSVDPSYTSKYLSMLVLSSYDETKVHSICIRGSCPFVMTEDNTFLRAMQMLFLITDALQLFCSFYHIVFECKIESNLFCFLILLDVIYFLDIYMQLITTITDGNVLITQPSRILMVRGKKITFLIDVIATIPYDYIAMIFSVEHHYSALLRMPRWLKLYKVIDYFIKKENSLFARVVFLRICRYIAADVILITLLICLTYLLNCTNHNCKPYGWLRYYNTERTGEVSDLTFTMHYVLVIYTSAKLTYMSPRNIEDLINYHVIMVAGFYSTCINMAQIVAVMALKNRVYISIQNHIENVTSFIAHKKEMSSLKSVILEYSETYYETMGNMQLRDIYTLDDTQFTYVQKKIRYDYVVNILTKTNLFVGCSKDFIRTIANVCKSYVLPPDHIIVKEDFRTFNMYIMVQGFCELKSFMVGDSERLHNLYLRSFDTFPLIAFVHKRNTMIRVTTCSTVQILVIPADSFYEIIRAYPKEQELLYKVTSAHFADNERFLSYDARSMLTVAGSKRETVNMFRYKVLQHSTMPIKALGSRTQRWRRFLKYLFLTTFNPEDKRYFYYEIFRCIIITLELIWVYLLLIPSVYLCSTRECIIIVMVFVVCAFIDMFVRAHVQYYNDIGIRVTNVSYTWKHYRETSFFLDLYSQFPFHVISFQNIFPPRYRVQVLWAIMLCTRPLLAYRIIMMLNYLRISSKYRHRFIFRYMAYAFIVVLVTVQVAGLRLILSCSFVDEAFSCPSAGWIEAIKERRYLHDDILFFVNIYSISILGVSVNYWYESKADIIVMLFVTTAIISLKKAVIIYVTGTNLFEDTYLVSFQDWIRNYKRFISDKIISSKDVNELIEHFYNRQKRMRWDATKTLFQSYYPRLKLRIAGTLYGSTIKASRLFQDADDFFLNYMAYYANEKYYKKDADVIRCNDVQGKVYIVYKGFVEVKVAGEHVCFLYRGGMFGCFCETGITRQTISVSSRLHVTLLEMTTKHFYQVLYTQVHLLARVQHLYQLEIEFVEESSQSRNSIELTVLIKADTRSPRKHKRKFLNETHVLFRVFFYAMSAHLAPISSIVIMYYVAIDRHYYIVVYMIYIFVDLIFLCALIFNMLVVRVDVDSGVLILNMRELVKRYVKSFQFYLDIVTLLPISIIYFVLIRDERNFGVFLANKILRIFYLINFYVGCMKRRNVPRHLQWTFMVYIFAFAYQMIVCLWWIQSFWEITDVNLYTYRLYMQVASFMTLTGIYWDPNLDIMAALSTLATVLICVTLISLLARIFGRILTSSNNYKLTFTSRIETFFRYCSHTRVSKILTVRCEKYFLFLYRNRRGVQLPILMDKAPAYIRQDHMKALYGKHLEKHYLFCNTHVDFLRQIVMYLEPYLYLPGDIVARKDDKNDTMYFIESGEVLALDPTYSEQIYKANDSFGEGAGLINMGHKKTYAVLTVSVILSLNRKKWQYLLDWFPSTKEEIFSTAQRSGIF